jgi:hypothetical protein
MNLTLEIPDDLVGQLRAGGSDLSRRALEALATEEYKHERLSKPDLQRLLGSRPVMSSTVFSRLTTCGSNTRGKTRNVSAAVSNASAIDAAGCG